MENSMEFSLKSKNGYQMLPQIHYGAYIWKTPGQEDLLEEGKETHSSIFAWRIP